MPSLIVTPSAGGVAQELALAAGRTRIGGRGATHVLPGVVAGELVVEGPPWRVTRVEGSASLEHAGAEHASLDLAPGVRFGWAGHTFEFEPDAGPAPHAGIAPSAWRWLKAGMAVDLGIAQRDAARSVQDSVRSGAFRADAAATTVLGATPLADDDPRLEQRAARLFRDLAMAPTTRGVAGTARAGRGCFRSLVAFLVVQVGGLILFSLLVLALLLALRWKGRSLDAEADRLLDRVPGLPERPGEAPPTPR